MPNNSSRSSSSSVPHFGVLAGAGALVLYGLLRRNKTGIALATAGGLVAFQQARSQSTQSAEPATAVFRVNASAPPPTSSGATSKRCPASWLTSSPCSPRQQPFRVDRTGPPRRSELRWTRRTDRRQPGRRIAWRSLPGSQIETSGSVEFQDDPRRPRLHRPCRRPVLQPARRAWPRAPHRPRQEPRTSSSRKTSAASNPCSKPAKLPPLPARRTARAVAPATSSRCSSAKPQPSRPRAPLHLCPRAS